MVVVSRARTVPFLSFVQDEKGNFRCVTGTSCIVGENLPYRKCCTTDLPDTCHIARRNKVIQTSEEQRAMKYFMIFSAEPYSRIRHRQSQ
jgi:hypothetical protein